MAKCQYALTICSAKYVDWLRNSGVPCTLVLMPIETCQKSSSHVSRTQRNLDIDVSLITRVAYA